MRADELARLRPRLVEFTAQMLEEAVRRSDQRANGELYVRGLLTDGQRKSMQPMAVGCHFRVTGLACGDVVRAGSPVWWFVRSR